MTAASGSRVSALLHELSAALAAVSREELPGFLVELERLRAEVLLRVVVPPVPEKGDRFLTAKEAAAVLAVPVKAMYRESWPFAARVTEGRVRFSEKGLQRYIAETTRHS